MQFILYGNKSKKQNIDKKTIGFLKKNIAINIKKSLIRLVNNLRGPKFKHKYLFKLLAMFLNLILALIIIYISQI